MIRTVLFVVSTLTLLATVASGEPSTVQWQVVELSFQNEKTYERPYSDVSLHCIFQGPEGRSYRVSGFYDGDSTWKVRFCPPLPGEWKWKTEAQDTSLHHRAGRFLAFKAAAENANPLLRHGGILKVGDDRHHLTYSDGTPFFWLGDTWWFCPGSLVPMEGSSNSKYDSMFKTLIDKRKSQGFNIVQWASLGGFGPHAGSTAFIETQRGGKFDPMYWKMYDRYVEYANEAGIVPVIGFGFHHGLDQFSIEDLKFLWQHVVARYGAYSVTWLLCGEFNCHSGEFAQRIPKILELGRFVKEQDPYKERAMTVHPGVYSIDTHDAWHCDWYDFVLWQSGHHGHGKVPPTATYWLSEKLGKPYLESETQYEGIYEEPKRITADDVRLSAWHAIQSGCCGYTYGAHGLWYPTQNAEDKTMATPWGASQPWWIAMNFSGPDQLAIMKSFYEKLNWTKLRPSPDRLVLEEGYQDVDRPLLQIDDKNRAVLYCPTRSGKDRKIQWKTDDGVYQASWFNPRDGKKSDSIEVRAVTGVLTVPNRPDDNDWVLSVQQ